jgi:hypothetical protein
VAPSAFAGYSFHVAEAALVFANEALVCSLFPIHAGVHRAYHLATTAIHIGAPRGRPRSAGGRALDACLGLIAGRLCRCWSGWGPTGGRAGRGCPVLHARSLHAGLVLHIDNVHFRGVASTAATPG